MFCFNWYHTIILIIKNIFQLFQLIKRSISFSYIILYKITVDCIVRLIRLQKYIITKWKLFFFSFFFSLKECLVSFPVLITSGTQKIRIKCTTTTSFFFAIEQSRIMHVMWMLAFTFYSISVYVEISSSCKPKLSNVFDCEINEK